jgi:hypothetical protein
MKIQKFEIGRLEGSLDENHKFIAEYKDSGVLVYHSHVVSRFGRPFHKEIAKYFGIVKERVLGGGAAFCFKPQLCLGDYSTDSGSVPKEILEKFVPLLLDRYNVQGFNEIIIREETKTLERWWNDMSIEN